MRTCFFAVVLALLAFHCDQRDSSAVPLRTFAWLPEGETLEVTYTSSGCEPADSYRLVFQRSPEYTATITTVRSADGTGDGKELGRITLTREEVDGLDNLFRLYRSGPKGSCTTVERITLTRRQGETVLATEQFVDSSCAAAQMEDAVTSICELVARGKGKK